VILTHAKARRREEITFGRRASRSDNHMLVRDLDLFFAPPPEQSLRGFAPSRAPNFYGVKGTTSCHY
jgi:hypothetical protein